MGIETVTLSLTIAVGLLRAVLIPISKKTFGFSIVISTRTRSAVFSFLTISPCINSEPSVIGDMGVKPAFYTAGVNKWSNTWTKWFSSPYCSKSSGGVVIGITMKQVFSDIC